MPAETESGTVHGSRTVDEESGEHGAPEEHGKGAMGDGTGAGDEDRPSDRPEEREPAGVVGVGKKDGSARRTTRRFPLFTRDTARPEGGGRAAPGDAPAPARQWPVLAVLSVVALGLLLTALDVFRVGLLVVGVALLGGGVMRWMLPDVGILAVRSRFTDTVTYALLGTMIVLLALMAQPKPWLTIPFFQNVLHYTIQE